MSKLATLLAAVALLMGATACGDDDDDVTHSGYNDTWSTVTDPEYHTTFRCLIIWRPNGPAMWCYEVDS